jgi:serine/threonine-protein kinase
VGDRFGQILDVMTRPKPADRFRSAEEVLQILKPAPAPVAPPPPTTAAHTLVQSQTQSTTPHTPAKVTPPPSSTVLTTPSMLAIVINAGLTGVEGTLLFTAAFNLFANPGISIGLWGAMMGGLIFAQFSNIVEAKELLFLIALSIAAIFFLPILHGAWAVTNVFIIAGLIGAGMVAVSAFFSLLYQLLRKFF